MKALQFLFSLREEHLFFANGMNDAQVLIQMFTPERFDVNFKERYGADSRQFLLDLKKDVLEMNVLQVEELFPLLSVEDSKDKSFVLDILLDGMNRYIVQHIAEFSSIKKYREILLASIARDLQKELHFAIHYFFKDMNHDAEVTCNVNGQNGKHLLDISKLDHVKFNCKEYQLYFYFFTLYHEQYHCLIAEAESFSTPYNLDLLEFVKRRKYEEILKDCSNQDWLLFYHENYENNHEEAQANFYGMDMALEKIKEISPYFPMQKVSAITSIERTFYEANRLQLFFRTSKNKMVRQDTFLNEELDKLLIKYPSYVSGMLTKVYRRDGTRKNFIELLQDRDILLETEANSREEIQKFYDGLLYQSLEKFSVEDIVSFSEENNLEGEIRECFLQKIEAIEKDIKRVQLYKPKIYLKGYFAKKIAKIHYSKDLREVYRKYKQVEMGLKKSFEQNYIK